MLGNEERHKAVVVRGDCLLGNKYGSIQDTGASKENIMFEIHFCFKKILLKK